MGQPSHRAVYLTYIRICINIKYYINERTEAPKPDTKTPKTSRWKKKTQGTSTLDQGSGTTLGTYGYANAKTHNEKKEKQPNTAKADRRMPHLANDCELQNSLRTNTLPRPLIRVGKKSNL